VPSMKDQPVLNMIERELNKKVQQALNSWLVLVLNKIELELQVLSMTGQQELNSWQVMQVLQVLNSPMMQVLNTIELEQQELNKLVNKPGQQERSILAPSALNSWTVNCKRPEWHTPATEFL